MSIFSEGEFVLLLGPGLKLKSLILQILRFCRGRNLCFGGHTNSRREHVSGFTCSMYFHDLSTKQFEEGIEGLTQLQGFGVETDEGSPNL